MFQLNDYGFKKYQLRKKFIFWQLVAKIANFTDIRQNNSIFAKKKKEKHLFYTPFIHTGGEKSQSLIIFDEIAYLRKKSCI